MKKLLNKKNFVIVAILALFIFAVIVNITSNKKETKNTETGADDNDSVAVISNTDYYTAFRENRNSVREKEIAYLESILNQQSQDQEAFEEANKQKLAIVECMETELIIESAIKSKGFKDAAVTFHKGAVNVVVNGTELKDSQVAQILDIVMRHTGEPAENINISLRR